MVRKWLKGMFVVVLLEKKLRRRKGNTYNLHFDSPTSILFFILLLSRQYQTHIKSIHVKCTEWGEMGSVRFTKMILDEEEIGVSNLTIINVNVLPRI
jgi:hypothetical protein